VLVRCQHCGSQVRVEKRATSALVSAIVMVAITVVGGAVAFYRMNAAVEHDTGFVGSRVSEIAH